MDVEDHPTKHQAKCRDRKDIEGKELPSIHEHSVFHNIAILTKETRMVGTQTLP